MVGCALYGGGVRAVRRWCVCSRSGLALVKLTKAGLTWLYARRRRVARALLPCGACPIVRRIVADHERGELAVGGKFYHIFNYFNCLCNIQVYFLVLKHFSEIYKFITRVDNQRDVAHIAAMCQFIMIGSINHSRRTHGGV